MKGLWILLVASVLAACSRDDATYTIAAVSPWNEAYGLMARQGTELAVDGPSNTAAGTSAWTRYGERTRSCV